MICPKCNSRNEYSNIYCCKCGKKLPKNELGLKNKTSSRLKLLCNTISKTLDKLLDNKKSTALVLAVMVGIISINIYRCIHKNKPHTKTTSINKPISNSNINKPAKPVQAKKSNISKEQIAAEKKIIDAYVSKVDNPSYTDYKNMDLDLNNKLNNNYFKSNYKKDAILLKAYAISKHNLKTLSKNSIRDFDFQISFGYFVGSIGDIYPDEILDYHIDVPKIFGTIKECSQEIFNISIDYWQKLHEDKSKLSKDDWVKTYVYIKDPSIGMTRDEILVSTWGKPDNIHTTTSQYGTDEQWVYGSSRYIYFENGVVTTIQN
ncbi:hypothetical protein [Clostridium botulinum]|uniref:hypothetical protein n=1 Tax=Clostridium botulinum TaxID=1491 RepID=UPI00057E61D8|nr:hypothetical protein [Clostridium botulinum]QPW62192.1 hypothetical protein IG390_14885 [Clostridium botulinum]